MREREREKLRNPSRSVSSMLHTLRVLFILGRDFRCHPWLGPRIRGCSMYIYRTPAARARARSLPISRSSVRERERERRSFLIYGSRCVYHTLRQPLCDRLISLLYLYNMSCCTQKSIVIARASICTGEDREIGMGSAKFFLPRDREASSSRRSGLVMV